MVAPGAALRPSTSGRRAGQRRASGRTLPTPEPLHPRGVAVDRGRQTRTAERHEVRGDRRARLDARAHRRGPSRRTGDPVPCRRQSRARNVLHTRTSRVESLYGSGPISTLCTTLKIAVFAPTPSASVVNDDGGKTWLAAQRPRGIAQVTTGIVDPRERSRVAVESIVIAVLPSARTAARASPRQAAPDEFVFGEFAKCTSISRDASPRRSSTAASRRGRRMPSLHASGLLLIAVSEEEFINRGRRAGATAQFLSRAAARRPSWMT